MSGPDFTELVGDELSADEAARLRRIHEMLVEAGPPPELPPILAEPPGRSRGASNVSYLPRRRLGASLLIAAAVAAVAFGGGYLLGHRNAEFTAQQTIPMHATDGTNARASLQFADEDKAGNSPIRMVVRGLPDLGKKGYYELWLTRGTRLVASCGTFVVGGPSTDVRLNAPYLPPSSWARAGWVVVTHLRGQEKTPVVMTT